MIKVKFNDNEELINVSFGRSYDNVIFLIGNVPKSNAGFKTYRMNGQQLGDFSDYTTIYRELDNGVQFSNDGSVYVEPIPPSLDEIKQAKISELKSARDTEELSPVSYGGYRWDFDDKAQMRINGAITVLGENTITWTSADNEEIKSVTVDDLKSVVGQAAIRSNALHVKYRDLKAQVEACETIDDVRKVEW